MKIDWVRLWGDRAYFAKHLVFVELPCRSWWRYYKVYAINDGDRLWFEVFYSGGIMQAVVEEFGETTTFYKKDLDSIDWDNFSLRAKRKVFKEIEKAFLKQYPNAL